MSRDPAPTGGKPPAPSQRALLRAELVAGAWELFSGLLFVSAVTPQAFGTPWPATIFIGSLIVSAVLAPRLLRRGAVGFTVAAALRIAAWPAAVTPLALRDPRTLIAAAAFGLMAAMLRRSGYRWELAPVRLDASPTELRLDLRPRLTEAAVTAGIVGGHLLMLFSVGFLRTQSTVVFRAWWELVPILAIVGTVAFEVAIRVATQPVLRALRAGSSANVDVLRRGLARARQLPTVLGTVNFAFWFGFTSFGVFYFQTGPSRWAVGDAAIQVVFAALFAWGVSYYQRGWHRDILRPVILRLSSWIGEGPPRERLTLRLRMLRDFGLPLVFMAALSLLSSVGLYRTMAGERPLEEDLSAFAALAGSFALLMLAMSGVVLRAAKELAEPLTQVAQTAEVIAGGKLDAIVETVRGPTEIVGLSESVERMRQALSQTIGALEEERANLEQRVESRTSELRSALEELKSAQAALVQGERLASIGELVAGVAHEINNPLNAIAGAANPLEELVQDVREVCESYRKVEALLPEEHRKRLETLRSERDLDAALEDLVGISAVIQRATERSVRIVQTLKSFSRVSTEAERASLQEGLEETSTLLGSRLRQSNIELLTQYGDLPPVMCRPAELNQVFMNLLVNAIHALEGQPAGNSRRIQIETVCESGDEGHSWAVVEIADNGPGVPEELRERIFNPFFTTKPRGQGTGLGLSISTDIIRRHGGELRVERKVWADGTQRGTRMICRIPVDGPARARTPSIPGIPG